MSLTRSSPTMCWTWSASTLFDAVMVFLNCCIKNEKKSTEDKKIIRNNPAYAKSRGGSRISGTGVNMYKRVGVRYADSISYFF